MRKLSATREYYGIVFLDAGSHGEFQLQCLLTWHHEIIQPVLKGLATGYIIMAEARCHGLPKTFQELSKNLLTRIGPKNLGIGILEINFDGVFNFEKVPDSDQKQAINKMKEINFFYQGNPKILSALGDMKYCEDIAPGPGDFYRDLSLTMYDNGPEAWPRWSYEYIRKSSTPAVIKYQYFGLIP